MSMPGKSLPVQPPLKGGVSLPKSFLVDGTSLMPVALWIGNTLPASVQRTVDPCTTTLGASTPLF